MSDKEIEEKANKLASKIRERIAMNQDDTEWVASEIKWMIIFMKLK